MHRRPSTPFAALGLLRFGPLSGYDLRREVASGLGHFWSESYGQIYPALRALARTGFARRRVERGAGRRARIVYSITAKGREALRLWTLTPPRATPPRNELLLKLYLGGQDSAATHAAWLRRAQAEASDRLRRVRRLKQQLILGQSDRPGPRLWMITLEHEEKMAEAAEAWCRRALATYAVLGESRSRARTRRGGSESGVVR